MVGRRPHKLFDRVAWSYMPANLTGCSVLVGFILFALLVVFGGMALSRAFDSAVPEAAGWLIIIGLLIAFTRFCRRHS